ncbi:MAG: trehalose-6-phosphate synthase [Comamonadaceae bacterium]|nr:trehalose-6-phosphate synthase [Comamonadaceae bacterium]
MVLVQDYHFALLPRDDPRAAAAGDDPRPSGTSPGRTRSPSASARGGARSSQGMLGSTILGFHTRFHCKNFIETVDRYLEARIEHEHSTIAYRRARRRWCESYPISIEWPTAEATPQRPPVAECRRRAPSACSCPPDALLGVGVDRLRLHQGHPRAAATPSSGCSRSTRRWIGRFIFVQVAAPHAQRAATSTAASRSACSASPSASTTRFGAAGYAAGAPAGRSTTSTTRSTSSTAPPTSAS